MAYEFLFRQDTALFACSFVFASFISVFVYANRNFFLKPNSYSHRADLNRNNVDVGDQFNIDNNVKVVPRSVNYHFTRKCNYACGFCFHTAKTSFMLDLEDAKRGLRMLKNAGNLSKINSL